MNPPVIGEQSKISLVYPSQQVVILGQLQRILPNIKKVENIKRKAKLNGEFRNIQPPEQ